MQFGGDALRQRFAQIDAPLIEGVDVPEDALRVVNDGRNPLKFDDAFFSGIKNAVAIRRRSAPEPGQGQAAALCSLAKRTLDAA